MNRNLITHKTTKVFFKHVRDAKRFVVKHKDQPLEWLSECKMSAPTDFRIF